MKNDRSLDGRIIIDIAERIVAAWLAIEKIFRQFKHLRLIKMGDNQLYYEKAVWSKSTETEDLIF